MFSFVTYIPCREANNVFQHLDIKTEFLPLIPAVFMYNKTIEKQTTCYDFYHYIVVYIMYAITQLNIHQLNARLQKIFSGQNEINKLYAICPGFYRFLDVG